LCNARGYSTALVRFTMTSISTPGNDALGPRMCRPHRGRDEYPRGLISGNASNEHCFLLHFEHRMRFATYSKPVSQTQSFAKV